MTILSPPVIGNGLAGRAIGLRAYSYEDQDPKAMLSLLETDLLITSKLYYGLISTEGHEDRPLIEADFARVYQCVVYFFSGSNAPVLLRFDTYDALILFKMKFG